MCRRKVLFFLFPSGFNTPRGSITQSRPPSIFCHHELLLFTFVHTPILYGEVSFNNIQSYIFSSQNSIEGTIYTYCDSQLYSTIPIAFVISAGLDSTATIDYFCSFYVKRQILLVFTLQRSKVFGENSYNSHTVLESRSAFDDDTSVYKI